MELQKAAGIVRFGAFELDRNSGELRKSGLKIHLRDQPFRILAMLLELPGEIITREQIQRVLWPNDTVVEFEHSINAAIKALRAALGDDAENPRFVETLPRRGYRFIAPMEGVGAGLAPPMLAQGSPLQDMAGDARYRLLEKLGAGGMGEVYKAEDLKLGRAVALKFLPEDFTSDPKALDRFRREAQLASSLNHPHICAIYDTGELGGRQFISMELVEGETLAKRLVGPGLAQALTDDSKRPTQWSALPIDKVLEYGIEIAGALAAAHRLGIIHRDLKPQNIMLTKSGTKLLDFGLAKVASGSSPAAANLKVGATMTTAESITAQGAILGTLHHMAPEQLEGKPADARSDIFAFGCVLYEMATGKRAFEGESSAQVMVAIMQNKPQPMSQVGAVHPSTDGSPPPPPAFERAVKKCLAKDPDDRWQTAADLRDELKWIEEGDVVPAVSGPRPNEKIGGQRPPLHRARPWALAVVGIIAAIVFSIVAAHYMLQPKTEQTVIRFSVSPPENTSVGGMSISPDGRRLAFVGTSKDGRRQLWVRSLDNAVLQPLPGTDGARYPFWSPDSHYLGFFVPGSLKKIDVTGGPAQTLCRAAEGLGGSWNADGEIAFAPDFGGPLWRVSQAGGSPSPLTTLDPSRGEVTHGLPWFLPDGRHFLYWVWAPSPSDRWVCVGSLDSKETKRLVNVDSPGVFSPPGYLLYWRAGTLMAQPFDARRLLIHGDAVPIAEHAQVASISGNGILAYSETGSVAYFTGAPQQTQLQWFDRRGREIGTVGQVADYSSPSLSPDGTRAVVGIRDAQLGTRDLWVFDLKRGTASRFTFDPADDFSPIWSHDGRQIVFSSTQKGTRDIYQKAADGLGGSEPVFESKGQQKSIEDCSSDGRYVVYNTTSAPASLWILPLFGNRKPFPFVQSAYSTQEARISPNGRYIAYASSETGEYKLYVQSFPEHSGKWQVSTAEGRDPEWRRDGQELFFLSGEMLMAVEVKTDGPQFKAGIPEALFEAHFRPGSWRSRYAATADGQRFLAVTPIEQQSSSPITVVMNWTAQLKKQ